MKLLGSRHAMFDNVEETGSSCFVDMIQVRFALRDMKPANCDTQA